MKKLYLKKSAQDISVRKAQDIQDDIFRKMNIDEKMKLGSDFSMYCLKRGLSEGTLIPTNYLRKWLRNNKKPHFLRSLANLETVR